MASTLHALQAQARKHAGQKLKILVYGINYWPEPTGIGKYTGEMAAWLVSRGHEVRVVTAPPYYPAWKISPGYRALAYTRALETGATVFRCPLWVPGQPSGAKRMLHLFSFALSSLPVVLRQIFWRPDVVWMAAPAFACAPGAIVTAKLSGATSWLHIQDFEVDAAFDLGFIKGQGLRRFALAAERWLMRRFDITSTISHKMVDRLRQKGVPSHKTLYFPNWVDTRQITPLTYTSPYRAELGLGRDKVVALFSGTLAAKQGLHLLPEVARRLAVTHPEVHIVIAGDGVMKSTLQADTRELHNVTMLPLQPRERLNEFLGMADIHLLPQDPAFADLVMPSKLTAMLASGRPVISTVHAHTEIGNVLTTSGVICPPGDIDAFADAIGDLARAPERRQLLGQAGRLYAEQHLSIDGALNKLIQTVPAAGLADYEALAADYEQNKSDPA